MKRIPMPVPKGLYRGMAVAALPAAVLWCVVLTPVAMAHPHVLHVAMRAAHKMHRLAGHARDVLFG